MNITTLPVDVDLDTALQNLADAGIGFSVVCSGPEPICPRGRIADAA